MEEYIKVFGKQKSGNGVYIVEQGNILRVVIVYNSGTFTDYPIQYDDGTIAFDNPYKHKATTRMMVKRAYRFINSINEAIRLYDKRNN